MKFIKHTALLVSLIASLTCCNAYAKDEDYPTKPITLIVPWNPGGSVDLTARKIAEILGKSGATVIVENVPGASSIIGLTKVSNAQPDGYTIGIATSSLMGIAAQKTAKINVESFTALNQTTLEQMLLVVPKDSSINSIESLISEMKNRDGSFSIATPGNNNVNHVSAAMLARAAKVNYVHTPYTGGSKILTDLAGKQIDAAILKPSETLTHIQSGLIKPIGVFSSQRVDVLPEVPTFAEKKIDVFPFGTLEQMSYLVAPKNITPGQAKKMQDLFAKTIQSDDYKQFAKQNAIKVADVRGNALQKQAQAIQNTFEVVAPKVFTKE